MKNQRFYVVFIVLNRRNRAEIVSILLQACLLGITIVRIILEFLTIIV